MFVWAVLSTVVLCAWVLSQLRVGKAPPGIPAKQGWHWFMGSTLQMKDKVISGAMSLGGWLTEEFENNGWQRYYFGLLGGMNSVVCHSPEDLESILREHYEDLDRSCASVSDEVVSEHAIFSKTGEDWRRLRGTAMHIVSSRNLRERMSDFFGASAQQLVQRLKEESRNGPVDFKALASSLAFDNVSCIAVNRKFDSRNDPEDFALRNNIASLQRTIARRIRNPFWWICKKFRIGELEKNAARQSKEVQKELAAMMDSLLDEEGMPLEEKVAGDHTVVGMYLQSQFGKVVDREELRNVILSFMQAGSDTTSNSIQASMVYLCKSPEWQEKLAAEALKVFGDSKDTALSYDDVHGNAPVAEACFLEAMRLHPPITVDLRRALTDIRLQDGTIVPKGVFVNWAIQSANLSPKTWGNDATTFNPGRWLGKRYPWGADTSAFSGDSVDINEFMYPTFNAGPRRCMGIRIAMFEGPLTLLTLFRHLRFTLAEEPSTVWSIANEFEKVMVNCEPLEK